MLIDEPQVDYGADIETEEIAAMLEGVSLSKVAKLSRIGERQLRKYRAGQQLPKRRVAEEILRALRVIERSQ